MLLVLCCYSISYVISMEASYKKDSRGGLVNSASFGSSESHAPQRFSQAVLPPAGTFKASSSIAQSLDKSSVSKDRYHVRKDSNLHDDDDYNLDQVQAAKPFQTAKVVEIPKILKSLPAMPQKEKSATSRQVPREMELTHWDGRFTLPPCKSGNTYTVGELVQPEKETSGTIYKVANFDYLVLKIFLNSPPQRFSKLQGSDSQEPLASDLMEIRVACITMKDTSFIVQCVDFNMDNYPFYYVMQYVPTSLHDYPPLSIYTQKILSNIDLRVVFLQTAMAINAMHLREVAHNDIKPSNILVDSRGDVWVANFGHSYISSATLTRPNFHGSEKLTSYMHPFLFWNPAYKFQKSLFFPSGYYVDWWAYAAILHEFLCGTLETESGRRWDLMEADDVDFLSADYCVEMQPYVADEPELQKKEINRFFNTVFSEKTYLVGKTHVLKPVESIEVKILSALAKLSFLFNVDDKELVKRFKEDLGVNDFMLA